MISTSRMGLAGLLTLSLVALPLTACDDDGGGAASCGVTVAATTPAAGAVVSPGVVEVVFSLSGADSSSASVSLAQAGSPVAGTSAVSADKAAVTFTPDAPLAASSAFTATLSYCGGTATVDFTTGAPPLDLVDNVYVLDLSTADFVEPAGVGTLIAASLTLPVFLKVTEIANGEMTMLGAVGLEGTTEQNLCYETFDMFADFTASPTFTVTSDSSSVSLAGVAVTLYDIDIAGTFSADGSGFDQATMSFIVDVREVVDVLDDLDTWQDACTFTNSLNAPCVACADSVAACLFLSAEEIVGELLPGGTVVPLTAADVAGNASCTE